MSSRSGNTISQEDKECLLKALRAEGYDRVVKGKEKVLNKYTSSPKTRKSVEAMLSFYSQKSEKYNPYRLDGGSTVREDSFFSSHALFKWHHVLPQPVPAVADGITEALDHLAKHDSDFSSPERKVMRHLSSLLRPGKVPAALLDKPAAILMCRLLSDLEEEAVASLNTTHQQFVHVSQSFWKLLQDKEMGTTKETAEADCMDGLAASLDPFDLSFRWKLEERVDQIGKIVAESLKLAKELEDKDAGGSNFPNDSKIEVGSSTPEFQEE